MKLILLIYLYNIHYRVSVPYNEMKLNIVL